MIILLAQGQADVAAIRFSTAFLPDLGKFPRESEALRSRSYRKMI
jgi:hypothetical protein